MSNTRNRSVAALDSEKREFLSLVLARATSPWGDVNAPKDANGRSVPIGQPYLAHILYSLIPIDAPDCPTMGVDKYGRLYINFDAFMNPDSPIYGLASATKAMNHEPYHIMYQHSQRFEKLPAHDPETGHRKNHKAWNHAGDLTINQGIRPLVPDWALHVGEEGPYEKFPFNLTSEEYYQMIKDMKDVCPDCWQPKDKNQSKDKSPGQGNETGDDGQPQDGSEGSQGDAGDDSSDGAGSGKGESSGAPGNGSGNGESGPGDGAAGSGAGSGDHEHGDQNGSGDASGNTHTCPGCGKEAPVDCGSGAGGEPADWELGPDEAPKLEDFQIDDLRRATAEEIKRQSNSKNPGNIPGNLLLWAQETLKAPVPDWKSILRATVMRGVSWKRGKMDYSYSRPNRRNQNPKFVFPAMRSPKIRIAVGIDTSGSNLHNLGIVSKNVEEISRQAGCRGQDLLAFGVDVVAEKVQTVNSPANVLENMRGGGGTDMRVAFQVFEKLGKESKADIGVLLTDLETGWPEKPPKADMKFIVVGVLNSDNMDGQYVKNAQKALKGWADLVLITPEQLAKKD